MFYLVQDFCWKYIKNDIFWYVLQFFPLSENEGYDQNLYSAEGLPTYFESGLLYYMLELNCSFMTQPYGFYFLMFESSGIGVKWCHVVFRIPKNWGEAKGWERTHHRKCHKMTQHFVPTIFLLSSCRIWSTQFNNRGRFLCVLLFLQLTLKTIWYLFDFTFTRAKIAFYIFKENAVLIAMP